MDSETDDGVRVWLVERTYSDDEQNLIILTYATPDGERYFRKERALTSFGDVRDTTAAIDIAADNLGSVDDPDLQEQYAAEARRMADTHDPTTSSDRLTRLCPRMRGWVRRDGGHAHRHSDARIRSLS